MLRPLLVLLFLLLGSRINAIGQEERAASLQSQVGKINKLIERSDLGQATRVQSPANAYNTLRGLIDRYSQVRDGVRTIGGTLRGAMTEREAQELAEAMTLLDRTLERGCERVPLYRRVLDVLQGPSQERILKVIRGQPDRPEYPYLNSVAVLRCHDLVWSSDLMELPVTVSLEVRSLTRSGGHILVSGAIRLNPKAVSEYRTADEKRKIGELNDQIGLAERARGGVKDEDTRKRAESAVKEARAKLNDALRAIDQAAAGRKETCEGVEVNVAIGIDLPEAADEAKLATAKRITVVGKIADFEFRPAIPELKEPAAIASLTISCEKLEL